MLAKRAEGGFTLIEVMIAMCILTIALFGLLSTVDVAIKYNSGNKMRTDAVKLMEQALANCRSVPYNSLGANTAGYDENGIRTEIRNVQAGAATVAYTIRTTVTSQNENNYKNVEVTVRWSEKNLPKTQTVTTVVSPTLD